MQFVFNAINCVFFIFCSDYFLISVAKVMLQETFVYILFSYMMQRKKTT